MLTARPDRATPSGEPDETYSAMEAFLLVIEDFVRSYADTRRAPTPGFVMTEGERR